MKCIVSLLFIITESIGFFFSISKKIWRNEREKIICNASKQKCECSSSSLPPKTPKQKSKSQNLIFSTVPTSARFFAQTSVTANVTSVPPSTTPPSSLICDFIHYFVSYLADSANWAEISTHWFTDSECSQSIRAYSSYLNFRELSLASERSQSAVFTRVSDVTVKSMSSWSRSGDRDEVLRAALTTFARWK